jgi:hypothetical protein
MLQTLISRMAGYGASFKSYCITVTAGVIGFGLTLRSPAVAGLALLPVLTFAVPIPSICELNAAFAQLICS